MIGALQGRAVCLVAALVIASGYAWLIADGLLALP